MLLTRFVRMQLTIFALASVVAMGFMFFSTCRCRRCSGSASSPSPWSCRIPVAFYRFSNVTYRGVQVGKVTAVGPTATGTKATLGIDNSTKIPADVHAAVRSMSAVGEQYVDLVPCSESGPYLRDGSVIAARDISIPRPGGADAGQAQRVG